MTTQRIDLEFMGAVHDAATAKAGTNRDGEAVVKVGLLYTRGTAPSETVLILSAAAARQLRVQLSAALDTH
ncbi:MAG: hypothetical protein BroJett003_06350 [Planctomycetota bacterium]|nr:MAG: hypothetical protein BroJett003_06350 [Planctomycetota bacterium]